jgi:hypothetical protein
VNPQTLKKQHSATRRELPVFKYKNEICRLVAENEVILVVAETVRFTVRTKHSNALPSNRNSCPGKWQIDSNTSVYP